MERGGPFRKMVEGFGKIKTVIFGLSGRIQIIKFICVQGG